MHWDRATVFRILRGPLLWAARSSWHRQSRDGHGPAGIASGRRLPVDLSIAAVTEFEGECAPGLALNLDRVEVRRKTPASADDLRSLKYGRIPGDRAGRNDPSRPAVRGEHKPFCKHLIPRKHLDAQSVAACTGVVPVARDSWTDGERRCGEAGPIRGDQRAHSRVLQRRELVHAGVYAVVHKVVDRIRSRLRATVAADLAAVRRRCFGRSVRDSVSWFRATALEGVK